MEKDTAKNRAGSSPEFRGSGGGECGFDCGDYRFNSWPDFLPIHNFTDLGNLLAHRGGDGLDGSGLEQGFFDSRGASWFDQGDHISAPAAA